MDARQQTDPDQPSKRVAGWVRAIAELDDSAAVRVHERACSRPGWPPFEVVIAHQSDGAWHQHTIHRRLSAITRLDVEGAWRSGDACCDP